MPLRISQIRASATHLLPLLFSLFIFQGPRFKDHLQMTPTSLFHSMQRRVSGEPISATSHRKSSTCTLIAAKFNRHVELEESILAPPTSRASVTQSCSPAYSRASSQTPGSKPKAPPPTPTTPSARPGRSITHKFRSLPHRTQPVSSTSTQKAETSGSTPRSWRSMLTTT